MNSIGSPAQKRDTRTTIVRVMTFLGGIYFFLHFILPEVALERLGVATAHESISNGFIAIGAMAIGLGIINIVASHGGRLIFRKNGWFFSGTLLLGLFVTIGVTTAQWIQQRVQVRQIRAVQVIGEFASRIAEDAEAGPGKEKSFSPQGVIPPLAARVEALERYSRDLIASVENEERGLILQDPSSLAMREEFRQGLSLVRELVTKLSTHTWEVMSSESAKDLKELSVRATALGSSYAILRRAVGSESLISHLYDFLYNGLFNNLGSAMFALLGVYIASAAFRAFRIQSVESALMMAAALVVMLGQISFGRMVYEDMPALRQWLLEVPNSAAFRAIRLGAAVAGLLLAIRMWLSIESDQGERRR